MAICCLTFEQPQCQPALLLVGPCRFMEHLLTRCVLGTAGYHVCHQHSADSMWRHRHSLYLHAAWRHCHCLKLLAQCLEHQQADGGKLLLESGVLGFSGMHPTTQAAADMWRLACFLALIETALLCCLAARSCDAEQTERLHAIGGKHSMPPSQAGATDVGLSHAILAAS